MVLLLVGILTACGSSKPTNTVQDFMNSFKKGDLEKAATYIEGDFNEVVGEEDNEEVGKAMLEAISKNYKFEKPVEVSTSENKAKVEVEITSVDAGVAMSSTIAEVMPMAFATAFTEQTPESEKAFEDLMLKAVVKYLTSEDTPMVTRNVTLNLKANKEGEFKIVADDNFKEAILANIDSVENMFGEEGETEEIESEKEVEILSTIAENLDYDVNPIKVKINEVNFKKASNVPEQEINHISFYSDKEVGDEFNYLYVSYNAENTSEEDISFGGIREVVLFAEGKQEVIESHEDFIDYDEGHDGDYYGKVNKDGEAGFIFETDPNKVEKVRIVIDGSMNSETYDTLTGEQTVEFDLK